MSDVKRLRQRWKPGSIVQIDLEDGTYAYGQVLDEPMVAFYDLLTKTGEELPSLNHILSSKVIFQISVMSRCVTQFWPIIYKTEVDPDLNKWPNKWQYDDIAKKYLIWTADGQRIPVTWEECKDLENRSVWDCGSVEQRLRDHFAGRPCWYLEYKKPDWKFIPIKEFYKKYGFDFYFEDKEQEETQKK